MLSSSRFLIHLLDENDRLPSISLLLKSFFQDEPLAKCLELGEPIDFAQSIIDDAIRDHCSFVAYDLHTNKLVGLCVNEIKSRDDPHVENQWNEKIDFIFNLLDQMHHHVNLFDRLKAESLLHIFIINVDQNFRGHGLASRLISTSLEHAKKMNIRGAFAEATNIYSLIPFQQQHFQIYYRLNYLDYDRIRLADLTEEHQNQCQLVARSL